MYVHNDDAFQPDFLFIHSWNIVKLLIPYHFDLINWYISLASFKEIIFSFFQYLNFFLFFLFNVITF